jgi:hypothetical protein
MAAFTRHFLEQSLGAAATFDLGGSLARRIRDGRREHNQQRDGVGRDHRVERRALRKDPLRARTLE